MAPSEFKSQQAGQLRRELGALRETHAATERQHALDIAAVKAELRKERAGAAGKCPTCVVRKTVNVDGKLEYVRKTVNARCPAAGSAPRCGGQGKSKSAGGGKALAAAELTTHLTFDRLPKLMAMLERWQGGVVAAVVTADAEQEAALRNFSARWGGRLNLVAWRKPCSYPFNYPVNFLRNLATDAARADVVLGVDVDFVPSAGLHGKLVAMARAGAFAGVDAFAVPAFLALPGARLDDQAALLRAVANHTAKPILTAGEPADVDGVWEIAHAQFIDYPRWYQASEPYQRPFTWHNEPYVALNASHPCAPRYDERFVFYGGDKVEFVHHLAALGWRLMVLPHEFLVHERHPRAKWNQAERFEFEPVAKALMDEVQHRRGDIKCPCTID